MSKKAKANFKKHPILISRRRFGTLILLILLFLLAMAVPPVIAQKKEPSPLQQAQQFYRSGEFEKAAQTWQQMADLSDREGNKLNQAMSLSNLSLTQQQLGKWELAKGSITQSLTLLKTLEKTPEQQLLLAQTLDIQGQLEQKIGQSQAALETWQQAAEIYRNTDNRYGQVSSQINQAQAMLDLGLYLRACSTLLQSLELEEPTCQLSTENLQALQQDLLNNTRDPLRDAKARGLRSLGNVLRAIGNLEQSQKALLVSLAVAKGGRASEDIHKTWLNLGNTQSALAQLASELQDPQKANIYFELALASYQEVVKITPSSLIKLQAQLNQLELQIQKQQWSEADILSFSLQTSLTQLPLSRNSLYLKITLAKNLVCLQQKNSSCLKPNTVSLDNSSYPDAIKLLETALSEAQALGDLPTQSSALGLLGRIYENMGNLEQATTYTQQALLTAQVTQASSLTYQWQWQLGRLLKAQGKPQEALNAYVQAVKILQSLRSDLVAINSEIQFTFRESVEPVYREYVGLLLNSPNQDNLKQARETIDSLQVAELENYFRSTCLDAKPVSLDEITDKNDSSTAIIYPILLQDRWEIILKLPQQSSLNHYTTPIKDKRETERTLELLSQLLKQSNTEADVIENSRIVYNWLLREAEQDLKKSEVKTLVFVLDSGLRNIPMSVLHDGQKYLVEKYSIALTPSLQLLDPRPLKRGELKGLAGGLSEARQGFSKLTYVDAELAQVRSNISSVELLNQDFTNLTLQAQIKAYPFPVVHLATHAQFSSQPENTFILTWNDRINVNQLNQLLRSGDSNRTSPIELLVLSACETLTGDKRAALGLAGVAIRAGARSTLATLWNVNDEATAFLMGQFYQALQNPSVTKAEALNLAQLALLHQERFKRPHYWASYVLLGNWL